MKLTKAFIIFFKALAIGSFLGATTGAYHQLAITAISIICIIALKIDIQGFNNQTIKN